MTDLERIREMLKGQNYSEVARQVGVTRAYISAIAKGTRTNPSDPLVKSLLVYLEKHG